MSGGAVERELALLARVGAVEVDGRPVSQLVEGGELVWQRFEQSILSDIRNSTGGAGAGSRKAWRLQLAALSALALAVTALAALKMRIRRPRVLVFSIDKVSDPTSRGDARIRSVYEALRETDATFIECLHTAIGGDFWPSLLVRRRLALYLEVLDLLWRVKQSIPGLAEPVPPAPRITAVPPGTPAEQAFMRHTVTRCLASLPRHRFRTRLLARLCTRARPRLALLLDDTRHYHDVTAALRRAGVPSYAIQHGQFTPWHVGWRALPGAPEGRYERADHIIVWSEHWRQTLTKLASVYPSEAIIVGGNPEPLSPLTRAAGEPLTLLIPYESEGPHERMRGLLAQLAAAGARIVFKPRPDVPAGAQLAQYGLAANTKLASALEGYDEPLSLALGTYSTLLYEIAARGIPVALMRAAEAPDNAMVEDGLAEAFDPDAPNPLATFRRVAALPAEVCAARRARLVAPRALKETLAGLIRTEVL